jgi:hypothetical protein
VFGARRPLRPLVSLLDRYQHDHVVSPLSGRRSRLAVAGILMVLGGCRGTPERGTVEGHLYVVGGPAMTAPRPVQGTVVAVAGASRHVTDTQRDGRFTLRLRPGTYTLVGTSPLFHAREQDCASTAAVSVEPGVVRTSDVYCQSK